MTWKGKIGKALRDEKNIKITLIKRSSNFSIKAQEDRQHAIEEH